MRDFLGHRAFVPSFVLAAVLLAGCGRQGSSDGSSDLLDEAKLGPTVGSVAAVARPEPVALEGYGLVGGLPGTGSGVCPVGLRAYLKQYILTQLPNRSINIDEFINSRNTAVVRLEGVIPVIASKGQKFDVQVRPVTGSDTTSLRGGWLYKAELHPQGTSGRQTRPLATVEGPVFVNLLGVAEPEMTDGFVLGGGSAIHSYTGALRLLRTDYAAASTVRNRLNERYGGGTATSVSATDLTFVIPDAFRRRPMRFVSMVVMTYLNETPELLQTRIDTFLQGLTVPETAERSEIALEALGRRCLVKLATLLTADDEGVRLRVARCVLNLGDDRGLASLRAIATDQASARRVEALDAIVAGAQRNDAASLARQLLRDADKDVVLAAYEHLREMEDLTIRQEFIGRSFYLERVMQTDRKAIFVTRMGEPRVVIFGSPLQCRDSLFVQSPDGQVVVDSRTGQDYASLTRQGPKGRGVIGPIRSGLGLSAIVRTLGGERRAASGRGPTGLGVPYADVIAVLEQLSAKEGVAAEFWAGPLPKIDRIVKK